MDQDRRRSDEPETVTSTEARQGGWGVRILIVLIVGIILAMVVWWGVEIYGGAIEPPASEQIGDPDSVEGAGSIDVPVEPAN